MNADGKTAPDVQVRPRHRDPARVPRRTRNLCRRHHPPCPGHPLGPVPPPSEEHPIDEWRHHPTRLSPGVPTGLASSAPATPVPTRPVPTCSSRPAATAARSGRHGHDARPRQPAAAGWWGGSAGCGRRPGVRIGDRVFGGSGGDTVQVLTRPAISDDRGGSGDQALQRREQQGEQHAATQAHRDDRRRQPCPRKPGRVHDQTSTRKAGKDRSGPFTYTKPVIGAPQYGSYPMRFVSSSGHLRHQEVPPPRPVGTRDRRQPVDDDLRRRRPDNRQTAGPDRHPPGDQGRRHQGSPSPHSSPRRAWRRT